jgi:hypothetical protein
MLGLPDAVNEIAQRIKVPTVVVTQWRNIAQKQFFLHLSFRLFLLLRLVFFFFFLIRSIVITSSFSSISSSVFCLNQINVVLVVLRQHVTEHE